MLACVGVYLLGVCVCAGVCLLLYNFKFLFAAACVLHSFAAFALPLKGTAHQKVEAFFVILTLHVLVHSQREPWLMSATVLTHDQCQPEVFFFYYFLGLVAHHTHKLLLNPKGTFTGVPLHKGITGFGATSEPHGFFRGPFLLDSVLYPSISLQPILSPNHHSGEKTRSLVEF